MSLADYLAKNYLTADPRPEKKSKKRKRKGAQEGLVIADDDATGWEQSSKTKDDEDGPTTGRSFPQQPAKLASKLLTSTVSHVSAEFRKSKKNNWQTLSGAPAALPSSTDQDAADAILASAAAESTARANADNDDEAPAIDDSGQRMASGARTGLMTGAQFTADMAAQKAAERARLQAGGDAASGKGQETIYRDASGRIINVAMKRAELRAKEAEAEAKKAREAEAAKGDVQMAEREKRKGELEEAKYMTFARHADDVEMNEELKEKDRWNDPAAGFLTKKKKGKSVTGRPLYLGAAPPNRYGIRPGHKWDGVDRGTGFESEWFKARNRVKSLQDLNYAWQMDE
ncbi:MAG: Pre-mRNA-splicing factor cwc26 [Stictis urceolatum]|nr:Pre-mRNA-splicing factor cwc26 [Stictis urceolata]